MAAVVKWDAEDVATWLEQCLQLPYRTNFLDAGITGQQLIELTEEQLIELGVVGSPHLLRLLSHIAVFRSQLGRNIIMSEDVVGKTMHADVDGSSTAREQNSGRGQRKRKDGSLDRSSNSAAKTGAGNRADATTPRHQRPTGRAKSQPGIAPVLNASGSSPATNGVRSARRATTTQQPVTPRGQPVAQTRRRARSVENVGQHHAVSSLSTPTKAAATMPDAATPIYDARPQVSTPASSSTWSPAANGKRDSFDSWHGKRDSLQDPSSLLIPAPWSPEQDIGSMASTKLDGSVGNGGKVMHDDDMQAAGEVGGQDLGGTSEFVRDFADDSEPRSARARSTPRAYSKPSSSCSESYQRGSPGSRGHRGDYSGFQDLSTSTKGPPVNSEFGKDRHRGAHFYSSNRKLLEPSAKVVEGPEYYQKPGKFYQGAMVKTGVPQFGRDTRRTLECMFQKGQDGPGVGGYEPPPKRPIRGGSIGSASRFRKTTADQKLDKSPGPYSYTPQHHYLSGFK